MNQLNHIPHSAADSHQQRRIIAEIRCIGISTRSQQRTGALRVGLNVIMTHHPMSTQPVKSRTPPPCILRIHRSPTCQQHGNNRVSPCPGRYHQGRKPIGKRFIYPYPFRQQFNYRLRLIMANGSMKFLRDNYLIHNLSG